MEEFIEHTDTKIGGFRGEYSWLSNMHPTLINHCGLQFKSVESAYQASKCETLEEMKLFTGMSGKESKSYIKTKKRRIDFDAIKNNLMMQLVFQKFLLDYNLAQKLIDTYPKELIETNNWNDTYWGECEGKGKNLMGKILMSTRAYLREWYA